MSTIDPACTPLWATSHRGSSKQPVPGFIPLYIGRDAVPRPPTPADARFTEVIDYLRAVTSEAGLNGRYTTRGQHVVVEAA